MSDTRLRILSVVAAAAALSLALAACQGSSPEAAPESAAPAPLVPYTVADDAGVIAPCVQEGDTVLTLGDSPLPTEALAFGAGERAVILAHQAGQRPCAWEEFGRELADAGYRVFIPSLSGTPEGVMGAAVAWLTDEGVRDYAIVGASMGGTFALAATPSLSPTPSLVVAISSPTVYGSSDALAAIEGVEVPVLLIVGDADGEFTGQVRQLAEARPAAELLVVPSAAHGIDLRASDAEAASRLDAALHDALG